MKKKKNQGPVIPTVQPMTCVRHKPLPYEEIRENIIGFGSDQIHSLSSTIKKTQIMMLGSNINPCPTFQCYKQCNNN